MPTSTTITIHVPRELRGYCNGVSEVVVVATNVRSALLELERLHPLVYGGLCDETGKVRRHINVFVNSIHIREREGLDTGLVSGDALILLPAVSGG